MSIHPQIIPKKEINQSGTAYVIPTQTDYFDNTTIQEQPFFVNPVKTEKKPDTYTFHFAKGSAPVITIQNQ
ncbi:hypothetical protein GCK72_012524 [Caenorhabditis remanei]|nr:hypothetical protein GCK72_012524 [Caenorhabditis remanei]KAF1756071.1 hypothetical protein GCK72_012524 [Caenorhabditis remanei]